MANAPLEPPNGATTLTHDEAPGAGDLLPTALAPGQMVDVYRIIERLGEGGMGIVYAAHDTTLNRPVALKFLRQAPGDAMAWTARQERLLREAQAMARLEHANVITVYGVSAIRSHVYLIMQHVRGQRLGDWLHAAPRARKDVVAVFRDAGRGLAAAHRAGIIHRDFKPENVLIDADGVPKVVDFGLARATGPDSPTESADLSGSLGSGPALTRTGAVLGTPRYMAPEQHRGEPASEQSDQFAFCVALYEALYGRHPYAGDTYAELAGNVAAGHLRPPPRRSRVPRRIWQALRRGLQPQPGHRFETMLGLLAQLRPSRGAKIIVGAGVVLAAVLLLIVRPHGEADGPEDSTTLPELDERLVLFQGEFSGFSELSPSGNHVVYSADDKLWLRKLAGGAPDPIELPKAFEIRDLEFMPDERKLVLAIKQGATFSVGLWNISAQEWQLLFTIPDVQEIELSPNGQLIAATNYRRLVSYDLADTSLRVLAQSESNRPSFFSPTWDPAGGQIAYVEAKAKAEAYVVRVVSAKDGSSREIGERTFRLHNSPPSFVWPDAERLFIASAVGGDTELFQVSLADGETRLVHRWPHRKVAALEWAPAARLLLYHDVRNRREMRTALLNSNGLLVGDFATLISSPASLWIVGFVQDRLLFFTNRDMSGSFKLLDLQGTYAGTPTRSIAGDPPAAVRENDILITRPLEGGSSWLHRIDARGNAVAVAELPEGDNRILQCARSGRCLLSSSKNRVATFHELDVMRGSIQPLDLQIQHPEGFYLDWDIHPDGQVIIVADGSGRLFEVELSNVELTELESPGNVQTVSWHTSGEFFYATGMHMGGNNYAIAKCSLDDRCQVIRSSDATWFASATVSDDGRRIAVGVLEWVTEAFVLAGL